MKRDKSGDVKRTEFDIVYDHAVSCFFKIPSIHKTAVFVSVPLASAIKVYSILHYSKYSKGHDP